MFYKIEKQSSFDGSVNWNRDFIIGIYKARQLLTDLELKPGDFNVYRYNISSTVPSIICLQIQNELLHLWYLKV